MLKRLRFKFVCINMALLTAMLCVILGLVVHFTRLELEAESLQMMRAAAAMPFRPDRPNAPGEAVHPPCCVVRINREGRLFATWGAGFQELSEQDLRELAGRAMAEDGPTGVLPAWQLRFLKVDGPEKCLVFAGISQERATLSHLTRTCVLAGCLGFGALLLISLFLARWAVRPVEQAWKQQRQFVSDASHELKTPLTVILTNAELLQSRGGGGPEAEHILTMSRQMRGLVENLLDLARIDSGTAQQSALELDQLVSAAALPFEALLFERGLTLAEEIAEGIVVKGSAAQLRQAVEIFLDNAQKYAAPGQVRLSLRKDGRGRCVLSLFSPGTPIPSQELENIFKRFYRLDKARSQNGSYGLGLSIVQGIAAAHHGRVWAESAGEGNTFFLELPTL